MPSIGVFFLGHIKPRIPVQHESDQLTAQIYCDSLLVPISFRVMDGVVPMPNLGKRRYLARGPTIPGGMGIKPSRDGSRLREKASTLRRQLSISKGGSANPNENFERGTSKKRHDSFKSRPSSECYTDASENDSDCIDIPTTDMEASETCAGSKVNSIAVNSTALELTQLSSTISISNEANSNGSSSKLTPQTPKYPDAPAFPEDESLGGVDGPLGHSSANNDRGLNIPHDSPARSGEAYLKSQSSSYGEVDKSGEPTELPSNFMRDSDPLRADLKVGDTPLSIFPTAPSRFHLSHDDSLEADSFGAPRTEFCVDNSIYLNNSFIPVTPVESYRHINNSQNDISAAGHSSGDSSVTHSANSTTEKKESVSSQKSESPAGTIHGEVARHNPHGSVSTPVATLDGKVDRTEAVSPVGLKKSTYIGGESISSNQKQAGDKIVWRVIWALVYLLRALFSGSFRAATFTARLVYQSPNAVRRVLEWRRNRLLIPQDHESDNKHVHSDTSAKKYESFTTTIDDLGSPISNVDDRSSSPRFDAPIRAEMKQSQQEINQGFVQRLRTFFGMESFSRFLRTIIQALIMVYQYVGGLRWQLKRGDAPTSSDESANNTNAIEETESPAHRCMDEGAGKSSLTSRCNNSVDIRALQMEFSQTTINQHSETEPTNTQRTYVEGAPEISRAQSDIVEEVAPLKVAENSDSTGVSRLGSDKQCSDSDSGANSPSMNDESMSTPKSFTVLRSKSEKVKDKLLPVLRSLSFKKLHSKLSNKSRNDDEGGGVIGNGTAEHSPETLSKQLSKRFSIRRRKSSAKSDQAEAISSETSLTAARDGGSQGVGTLVLEDGAPESPRQTKGKGTGPIDVGGAIMKVPKAFFKSLGSLRLKTETERFASSRSAKKTTAIIKELLEDGMSMSCSERKGGAFRLLTWKDMTTSNRMRAKIDIEATDEFSSSVVLYRDKGDGQLFSDFVMELHQLFRAKVSQGKPTMGNPVDLLQDQEVDD